MHQSIFSLINRGIRAKELNMIVVNDDWTEIIKLAQALMPVRPTSALKRYLCDEKDRRSFGGGKDEMRESSAN
jgi:hypothetical protein